MAQKTLIWPCLNYLTLCYSLTTLQLPVLTASNSLCFSLSRRFTEAIFSSFPLSPDKFLFIFTLEHKYYFLREALLLLEPLCQL